MVRIVLASPLAAATRGDREIQVAFEGTLRGLFEIVGREYGEPFRQKIFDGDGTLRRFVNVYVNGEDARFLAGLDTSIGGDATVDLLPAISGG